MTVDLGGLITELVSEKHPEWVSGAAPECGAGRRARKIHRPAGIEHDAKADRHAVRVEMGHRLQLFLVEDAEGGLRKAEARMAGYTYGLSWSPRSRTSSARTRSWPA